MNVKTKLVSLEKKYLTEALTQCQKCYDDSIDDECTRTCASRYITFMQLKQFVLGPK
jgi:hypothetical protein